MAGPDHDSLLYPPPSPFKGSSRSSKWSPYSNGHDFKANMAMILVILVCTLAFALAFNAIIRFFLRRRHRRHRRPPPSSTTITTDATTGDDLEKRNDTRKRVALAEALPMLAFSGRAKQLAGAECAICLSEFAEGDGVRVLPACNHGFHVNCIEEWISTKFSCPTCRSNILAAGAVLPGKNQCAGEQSASVAAPEPVLELP